MSSEPESETIALGLCQLDASQSQALWKRAEHLVEGAARSGCQVVCFPEMSFQRFFPADRADYSHFHRGELVPGGATTDRVSRWAKKHGVAIVANLFERAAPGICYDTSIVVSKERDFSELMS